MVSPQIAPENLQIQSDELDALEAIFGDDFIFDSSQLESRKTGAANDLSFTISPISNLLLTFSIPPNYPSQAVSVHLTRCSINLLTLPQQEELKTKFDHIISSAVEGQQECICEIATTTSEFVSECEELNRSPAEEKTKIASSKSSLDVNFGICAEEFEFLIVFIDHMNQDRTYMKTLASICASLGLTGRLFYEKHWRVSENKLKFII